MAERSAMNCLRSTVSLALLLLLLASGGSPVGAQEATAPPADLSGDWRVLLENSNSRKSIHFRIQETDGRLRGKVVSKEFGTQDLDGRREKDGKVLFWTTYYTREGASVESSFKGMLEGEEIVGECKFFRKSYRFRADRNDDEK